MEINLISIELELKKAAAAQLPAILDSIVKRLADATPVDTGEAAAGWSHNGKQITNDVEHIERLNEGSSQQAPSFFVEKTVLSHKGVTPSGTIVRSE